MRQLRYFKVVADAGSFARAAQDIRVAQPALSRSVAKLEGEIGSSLFTRHRDGVSLTDAGVRFYDHTQHVLGSVRELVEGMAAADGVPRGEVRLGAPYSIQSKLTLPVAAEFLKRYSSCKLDLIQDSGANLRHQVAEGVIDLAVVPNAGESGIHYRPLLKESICLICTKDDRSRFGAAITMPELLSLPLILTGYPDSLRLLIDRTFPDLGEPLDVRSEVNSSSVMVDLVVQGVGLGVAPSSVVARQVAHELDFVPIRGLEVSWAVAVNRHRRGLQAVVELDRLITSHVRSLIAQAMWPTAVIDDALAPPPS